MAEPLVIAGASTRAAAFSALAAGFEPLCLDLFADVDLHARCRVLRLDDYPQELAAMAGSLPPAPWMYTGALENYPGVIDAISHTRPLWGNPSAVVRQARDPRRLAAALHGSSWRFPTWQRAAPLGKPGSWLVKADRSAGGAQVKRWDGSGQAKDRRRGWYYQQHVDGLPCSAVYVAAGGTAQWLGASQQLIGTAWSGASGFRYAGSLGPLPLEPDDHASLAELGERLARSFGLVGLFGVDLVIGDERRWVIEVNPRYTASMEVLERSGRFSMVACHATACRDDLLPPEPHFSNAFHGKAILFARRDVAVTHDFVSQALAANQQLALPAVADIPQPESLLKAGWPVMTLLTQAASHAELVEQLQLQAAAWFERLYGSG
jgi:predicted ATP-grasp superfamily ATP-dependent carboligase